MTTLDRLESAPASLRAPRFDMFGPIHKGIRYALLGLLTKMGTVDFKDEASVDRLLEELGRVLSICESHVGHEDRFIHPPLAAKTSGIVSKLDEEHAEHRRLVAEVAALGQAVRGAAPDKRPAVGRTLYLHFGSFVADTLAHMAHEERVVQPLLERSFTDDELHAIHGAILAAIPPEENAMVLAYMAPALNRDERAALVFGARAGAPTEIFERILGLVRSVIREDDWRDLAGRLEHAA